MMRIRGEFVGALKRDCGFDARQIKSSIKTIIIIGNNILFSLNPFTYTVVELQQVFLLDFW